VGINDEQVLVDCYVSRRGAMSARRQVGLF